MKMEIPVIGFISPIIGVDGVFNTFRMGRKYGVLKNREQVFLMDEKKKEIFGTAEVLETSVGKLGELCLQYAGENHTQLFNDQGNYAEDLYRVILKIYGPHIVNPNKLFTVIKLKRSTIEH